MTDNLATVRDDEFDRVIGKMHDMTAVDKAISHTLGLSRLSSSLAGLRTMQAKTRFQCDVNAGSDRSGFFMVVTD